MLLLSIQRTPFRCLCLFLGSLACFSCSDNAGSSDNAGNSDNASSSADTSLSFFVSSQPGNDGGNFGGLAGADAFCTGLAQAVGSQGKVWKALLSTDTVDAKDRIGTGPWYNVEGVLIAISGAELFGNGFTLDSRDGAIPAEDSKRLLLLNETGAPVQAVDFPNPGDLLQHDILTGSLANGTRAPDNCNNWTSGSSADKGHVGHSDSRGSANEPTHVRWIDAHPSAGCDLASLESTGSAGLIYCFAE